MPFPLIPILAGAAIIGGAATLTWYANQSRERRARADRMAMRMFGRAFEELADYEQYKIQQALGG